MKTSPTKAAVSSVKSGQENKAYASNCIGNPSKKGVSEIEAVNTVKKAPGSVAR